MEVRCIWRAGAQLGEGVFWHPGEHAVYWVDIIASVLHRLGPDETQQSWHFPGRASAVMPCESGGLLATFEDGIRHIDTATADVTPKMPVESELHENRFNDGHSDSAGNFWFASMDDRQQEKTGSFYRMSRGGAIERVERFGKMCITNGPAFSCDTKWVYFTDTLEKKIFRAALDAHFSPGEPSLFIDFSDQAGHPDGMCTDTNGGLWVCHFGGHRITRFNTEGQPDEVIEMPVPNITKCAFGGAALNTLFVTTAATGLDDAALARYPLAGALFAVDTSYTGGAVVSVPNIELGGKTDLNG